MKRLPLFRKAAHLAFLALLFTFTFGCGGGGGGNISFVTSSLAAGVYQQPYNQTIQISGATAPVTWQIIAGSLPPGLSFCPGATGLTCTLGGAPTQWSTTPYTFTVKVTDSSNPAKTNQKQYSITVNPAGGTLTITTAGLPNGTVGTPYSSQVNAQGGLAPYQWNVTNAPPGLTFCPGATGLICAITGTPTQEGNYTVTVSITDSNNPAQTATRQYSIVINPPPVQHTLTVNIGGDGSGKVTSTPAGINCGSGTPNDCTESYNEGTTVTIQAQPDPGSQFAGWSGDCSGTNPTTQITMDADKTCTANFSQIQYTLTVTKNGNGTVTSNPAGINCGTDCSEPYASGTVVTLTATPDAGWQFDSWSGDPDCADGQVTMDADKTCTATFSQVQYTHTLTVTKNGSGTVTSNPAGINCGTDCSEPYASGTVVTLTATPDAGWQFDSWSGDPDCADGQVTMDADKTCTANFTTSGGGGGLTVTIHFKDRCGNPLPNVWAYRTEGGSPLEVLSDANGNASFPNTTAPYTITWGYDDSNPHTIDRLETARITDPTITEATVTIDSAPPSGCPGDPGTGTASISGSIHGWSPGDTGSVQSTAGGKGIFGFFGNNSFTVSEATLPDDGTPVVFALGASVWDNNAPEGIMRCKKWGLRRQSESVSKGQNLTGKDITIYPCNRDVTGNFGWPPGFSTYNYYVIGEFLSLQPEGSLLQYVKSSTPPGGASVPSTYSLLLPDPTNYNGINSQVDRDSYSFQFTHTLNDRSTPDDTNDDIFELVSLFRRVPVGQNPGEVNFLCLFSGTGPADDPTGTNPVPIPVTFSFSTCSDPRIVLTNIAVEETVNDEIVWIIHLQGASLNQFTLPDLSGTSLRPASLTGLLANTLYRWRVTAQNFDLYAILGGTDPETLDEFLESGTDGYLFKTAP